MRSMMLLCFLLFGAVCAFIAYAPGELTRVLLVMAWATMAAAAAVFPLLSLLGVWRWG